MWGLCRRRGQSLVLTAAWPRGGLVSGHRGGTPDLGVLAAPRVDPGVSLAVPLSPPGGICRREECGSRGVATRLGFRSFWHLPPSLPFQSQGCKGLSRGGPGARAATRPCARFLTRAQPTCRHRSLLVFSL